MTFRLDSAAAEGIVPGLGSRQDVGAREQRWKLELERAAFGARKAPAVANARETAARSDDAPGDAAAHRLALLHGGAPARNKDAVAPSLGTRASWPMAVALQPALSSLSTTAMSPAPAVPVPPTELVERFSETIEAHASNAPVARPVLRSTVASAESGVDPGEEHAGTSDSALEAQADEVQANAANAAERGLTGQFGAAHMHLSGPGDALQAYIRDANLTPQQAHALSGAIAHAVAADGKRLAGLTINGRPAELPGGLEQSAEPGDAASANGTAPPPPAMWYRTGELT